MWRQAAMPPARQPEVGAIAGQGARGPALALQRAERMDPMTDRRHYPRLNANMLWRSAGLRAPRRPLSDLSVSGALVYSDDLPPVGARLELELLVPGEARIEVVARVVRVSILPPSGPAFCDVALEFLGMTEEAKRRLVERLSVALPAVPHHGRQ
jgi:hypothetical protein